MKIKIDFLFDKETTGTVRYQESGSNPVVGTLYIKKAHLKEPYPKVVYVELDTGEQT